jgi:hypothetical protein
MIESTISSPGLMLAPIPAATMLIALGAALGEDDLLDVSPR